MKIIARIKGGFWIEATKSEVALLTGNNYWSEGRKKISEYAQSDESVIGCEIPIGEIWNAVRAIKSGEEDLEKVAKSLEEIAKKINRKIPLILKQEKVKAN